MPRIFLHQAGEDAKLNAGISVDGGGAGNTEGMMKGSCNHLGWKRAHEMQVQPFPSTAKPPLTHIHRPLNPSRDGENVV